jgi:hypothetical protein
MSPMSFDRAFAQALVQLCILAAMLGAGCGTGGVAGEKRPVAAQATGPTAPAGKVLRKFFSCEKGRPIVTRTDAQTLTLRCPSGEKPALEERYVDDDGHQDARVVSP